MINHASYLAVITGEWNYGYDWDSVKADNVSDIDGRVTPEYIKPGNWKYSLVTEIDLVKYILIHQCHMSH